MENLLPFLFHYLGGFDSEWNAHKTVRECVCIVNNDTEIKCREDLETAWLEKHVIRVKFRSIYNCNRGPVLVYGVSAFRFLISHCDYLHEVRIL